MRLYHIKQLKKKNCPARTVCGRQNMYYYIWPNLLALIKKQFMEVAGIDESAFDK